MRSSVLVYIVGTHVDTDDAFLLEPYLEQVNEMLIECNFTLPHRIVDPIDARNQDYVKNLRNQLLADMAVQSHLGELVPKGYLQIEKQLMEEQKKYRLNMLQGGNDVIVPIIQRKVLSERWHRDISYVTRALELLNLWGSVVYFGKDSNKQRHVFLNELVVYAPEWLTISVLGSIVQLMRQQKDKLKKNKSSSGDEPIVLHSELIKLSSVWQNIPSQLHEHVMEMLYSLDLGFAVSPASDQSKPFGERSSFFPQLLPFLPPRLLTWQLITSTTTEAVYIITLNGFAMGFHGVLFSRLQFLLKSVVYGLCWQCGFLFSDVSQSTLVTIHDDTQQIRICIRNSSNPSKSFNDIKVVIASLIDERYRGVRIVGEFIECSCDKCKNVKWNWDNKIYDQAFNDSNIQSLCKDTTSRADLAIAIGRYNQPDGSPHLFNIKDIMNTTSSQESLICNKSNNAVLVSALKRLIEQPVPSNLAATLDPTQVAEWSVDDVCRYLKQAKISDDVVEIFRQERIKGKSLASKANDEALKSMGVKAMGDREDVIAAIRLCFDSAPVTTGGYDVFVSYRRNGGSSLAYIITQALRQKGFNVFHDVGSLSVGDYEQAISSALKSARCVVSVMSPGALDRCLIKNDPEGKDWVRKEITMALKEGKHLLPVLDPSFTFPDPQELPEDMRRVTSYNGIKWYAEYPEAALEKLQKFIKDSTLKR